MNRPLPNTDTAFEQFLPALPEDYRIPLHTSQSILGNMLIPQRSGGEHELGGEGIQGH